MAYRPSADIVQKYVESVGRVTRRIEIYEEDGLTPWAGYDSTQSYIVDGSVTVDYSRAERRTIDLTLDNDSGVFDSKPGGFWYDKVIKVFRGLRIAQPAREPAIAVVVDAEAAFKQIRSALSFVGYSNVRYLTNATTLAQVKGYDLLIFVDGANVPTKSTLAADAYNSGINILTVGSNASQSQYPQVFGATRESITGTQWVNRNAEEPGITGWQAFQYVTSGTVYMPGGSLPSSVKKFASVNLASPFNALGVARRDSLNRQWVHLSFSGIWANGNFQYLVASAVKWLNPNKAIDRYEIQIGEFMIDSISETHFPHQTTISGRDYTKKLLLSKFVNATQFAATQTVSDVIKAIAINGGVDPTRIIVTNTAPIGIQPLFERDSTRWDAIKQICDSVNLEVYFTNTGQLVVEPFADPTTAAPQISFDTSQTGGQLVSYTRSANDTSLVNHIVVCGESGDSTTIPVWAEAKNTKVGSSTSIAEIGDRVLVYTSALMKTTAQCLAMANKLLSIYSLEEYQVDFDAICIDWLEAGDVIYIQLTGDTSNTPTRFLLVNFTIPLTLGPMSLSGKRMAIIS